MPSLTASEFMTLPIEVRESKLAMLSPEELEFLQYDWSFWARENQRLPGRVNERKPDGRWITWLLKAGRGFGKTRVGAETIRVWARTNKYCNLIGATADDARDIMVEGESGLLAVCPPQERPTYIASKRQLVWPNGNVSLIFTADEPERLRGKQHSKVWADEIGSWRYRESWDQMMMGLRLGIEPQVVATTTPRPTDLMKSIIADPNTLVTNGTTYDNFSNLAPSFISTVIRKYEGTRLGRQELEAEMLTDNPGALWTNESIEKNRILPHMLPRDLVRIVVGVDPAVTVGEGADETGIVVAAADSSGEFYILADCSMHNATPDEWAESVVSAYRIWKADLVVGETNNGGDLVGAVIKNKMSLINYQKVNATRGKVKRAEPIAMLYEQNRVHHVGNFPKLEDQMLDYCPSSPTGSPDRMDAMVWAMTILMEDAQKCSAEPVLGGVGRVF
jgi:phage terminase large subunit-like protein